MPRVIVNSTPLITGSLGVILKAKKTGIIKKVTPLMNQLISNGLYITKEIYDFVKSEAGE